MRRRATRGCEEEGRWFRNSEEGGQGVGVDQNGVIGEPKGDGEYMFQTAKNGLEEDAMLRLQYTNVVSLIEKEKRTLSRFLAPSVKKRIELEKESGIS